MAESDQQRKRALRKIKPGDGRVLRPMHGWQALHRSVFYLRLCGDDGNQRVYAVDVPYFDWEDKADLYINGRNEATAELPAAFPVTGGVIEVAASSIGLKRMHYVPDSGRQRQLTPDPASGEGIRARLDAQRPLTSRLIGALSWLILVVTLLLGIPQLWEFATSFDAVSDLVGTFTSPVWFPASVNTGLGVAAFAATLERALRLRYNWLLDGDVTDWDD